MIIEEYSDNYKRELLEALEFTQNLKCPPEQYRVEGYVNCFDCNTCWRYALMNSLPEYEINLNTIEEDEKEYYTNRIINEENLDTLKSINNIYYSINIVNDNIKEFTEKFIETMKQINK